MAVDGLDPRLRVFRCGRIVDSYAVIGDAMLVLVDSLVSPAAMRTVMGHLIAEFGNHLGGRALVVVNTHADWDHVWGNGLFSGPDAEFPASIVGRRETAQRMRSAGAAEFLSSFREKYPRHYDDARWIPPAILFDGRLRIDAGGVIMELVPTPGHTPDHTSIWLPELRLLLAGDAAEAPLPFVEDAEALPQLRASLAQLDALPAETALYCHAAGIYRPDLIRRNRRYFDDLEHLCRSAGDPRRLAEAPDPSLALGWQLEEAVPDHLPEPEELEFYREGHRSAIRAMAAWLAQPPATSES